MVAHRYTGWERGLRKSKTPCSDKEPVPLSVFMFCFMALISLFGTGQCWWEVKLGSFIMCRMHQGCAQVYWTWERPEESKASTSNRESSSSDNTALFILALLCKNWNLLCSCFPCTFYIWSVSCSWAELLIVWYSTYSMIGSYKGRNERLVRYWLPYNRAHHQVSSFSYICELTVMPVSEHSAKWPHCSLPLHSVWL